LPSNSSCLSFGSEHDRFAGDGIIFAAPILLVGVGYSLMRSSYVTDQPVTLGGIRRVAQRLRENPEVEVTALYWHLVDVIWIILYLLIYLMERS
jgi:hypothetical protein